MRGPSWCTSLVVREARVLATRNERQSGKRVVSLEGIHFDQRGSVCRVRFLPVRGHFPVNEPDLTADEIREITAESYADPLYFCKFFLSHLFPKRVPWVHRGIFAILSSKVDWLQEDGE